MIMMAILFQVHYGVYDDALHCETNRFNPTNPSSQKPLFGVCFGHQIIAHALVVRPKMERGWVLGTMEVTLTRLPDWIDAKTKKSILFMCIKIR